MPFDRTLLACAAAGLIACVPAAAQESESGPAAPGRLTDLGALLDGLEKEGQTSESDATASEEAAAEKEQTLSTEDVRTQAVTAADAILTEEDDAPAPPLTARDRSRLAETVARGKQLFAIAQAGFLTTRDMFARIADPEAAGIIGWVAEPEGNAWAVTYYAQGDEGPVAAYRGTVLGGRVVSREVYPATERPPLPSLPARMVEARKLAGEIERETCSELPFNVLVVPPASLDDLIDVYHITPPGQGGSSYPMGGHYLTRVTADNEVAQSRPLAQGCMSVAPPPAQAGAPPRPAVVAHRLDPLPTEIHVFSSLAMQRPLIVATGNPRRDWLVTGQEISEISN